MNSATRLAEIPECIQRLLPEIGSVNAAVVFCARSLPSIEGVMPTAARFISWGKEGEYGRKSFALVMSVEGDISASELEKELEEGATVITRRDDLLVFLTTEPKASLGTEKSVATAKADLDLDLAKIPEWTRHKRARVFESLQASYRIFEDQTLADVRIIADGPPTLERSNVQFVPPEHATHPCAIRVKTVVLERSELRRELETLSADKRASFVSKRVPELMESLETELEACAEADPQHAGAYEEFLGFAHVWAGMSYLNVGKEEVASSHFSSSCELTDAVECQALEGDDGMSVCPAPYMAEVAVATRDLGADDVVEESAVTLKCRGNTSGTIGAEELDSLIGRKVRSPLSSGEVVADYKLHRE